ncbi:MAG: dihydropyrimidinase [Verrucomicrobia bacterium]|nr:dihydropyrimidinase [Kiritimatiellia bacterium]MCP5489342.1 dihydropyrimidinase [Verrucomicrobiota bacterium]
MALLIKNGEIVNADGRLKADILVEKDTITRIGQGLEAPPGAEVINARGKYVFPGFIDPHVHIYLPFMGTYAKDTYKTASKAAVVGGTTTLIEMCCPAKADPVLKSYQLWLDKAEGNSACDFTFHMGVSRTDKKAEAELREIVASGISSFKVFLAYKGAFGVSDEELYNVMKLAKELGVIVTAHCENAELVAQMQAKLIAEGKTAPKWHYHSRPPMVEAEGVHHLATFAAMHGTHVYTVHTSCKESVTAALRARERGVNLWIETLIQYLTLDMTDAEKGGFDRASKFVMSPPLRYKCNQEFLWHGLRQGFINTLATDHAPFDVKKQKQMGRDDFTKIPNGIPSLEDRMTVFWTKGVCEGRIDLHRFVACASTETAKVFGLFPRKGTVSVGADADLVIWDPKYRGKIRQKKQHMNVDYNPFEGWDIKGRPSVVTVRGQVVARDGVFVGKLGHGQLVKREPNHF